MSVVQINIVNNTGYPLIYLTDDGNHGSIDVPSEGKRIDNGKTGWFTVKNSGLIGPQYKVYYKLEGIKNTLLHIYVEDSISDTGDHHVRVYPERLDYFYGDLNFSTDFKGSKKPGIDNEATVTLREPTKPNIFYVTSDVHFNESGAKDFANMLKAKAIEDGEKLLGIIVNGDNANSSSEYKTFTEYFYQEDYFRENGQIIWHNRMRGPIYEGVGNHDSGNISDVCDRNEDFEERRWLHAHDGNGNYSWDWCGVRFLQLNIFPGIGKSNPDRPDPVNHEKYPQKSFDSLIFLREQLKEIKSQGGAFVLCFHLGPKKTDRNNSCWGEEDKIKFLYSLADPSTPLNPLYLFCGHHHSDSGEYYWPETPPIPLPNIKVPKMRCLNTGSRKAWKFEIVDGANGKEIRKLAMYELENTDTESE